MGQNWEAEHSRQAKSSQTAVQVQEFDVLAILFLTFKHSLGTASGIGKSNSSQNSF